MKVMLRRKEEGQLAVYVPKKDLEEVVVQQTAVELWGGVITLSNGWKLELPDLPPETRLPVTVEARRLDSP